MPNKQSVYVYWCQLVHHGFGMIRSTAVIIIVQPINVTNNNYRDKRHVRLNELEQMFYKLTN